jgi:hypothetical protein
MPITEVIKALSKENHLSQAQAACWDDLLMFPGGETEGLVAGRVVSEKGRNL